MMVETPVSSLCPGCFTPKGNTAICPLCGFDERIQDSHSRLPYRTLLQGQYVLGRILGKPGGFGITYLGYDQNLNLKLAIKEFFPPHLVLRAYDRHSVVADSPANEGIFREGLAGFLKEARTLARFDHMNVVRVRNYFEANGTAYLVMDYYEGFNLSEVMAKRGLFSEAEAIKLMIPVLDGLRTVHENGILHRDIKPENVYLAAGNRPILLDFGAARAAVGVKSQNMTMVLTPGFAPIEQYASNARQGPYSDIYAAGATLYYLTTGRIPTEATNRVGQETIVPPKSWQSALSASFNEVVLEAMALKAEERPQTAQELLDRLFDILEKRNRPATGAAVKTTEPESGVRLMTCPACDAVNRLPENAVLDQVCCGQCGSFLLPRPHLFAACPKCHTINQLPASPKPRNAWCGVCKTKFWPE
ncbi:MAG: protein kinase [Bacteroidetes Order II. Incertae sedis bacterium]|nr:protein kinase [Bacteroidetes Order II. bacterium]